MEFLTTTISIVLLIALFVSPILILLGLYKLNLKPFFVVYLVLSVAITSILTLTFGWWSDFSNQILLSHYGYNYYGMNEIERFKNVVPDNIERVKSLEICIMGVGWPLKAFVTYVVYSPYLLIVYIIGYFIKKYKNKKKIN